MSETKPHFTRAQRVFAKRAASRMLTQEHREFPSSSVEGVVYHARIMIDGKVMCDCRGWTIKKKGQPRQCKHTKELVAEREGVHLGEFLYVAPYGRAPSESHCNLPDGCYKPDLAF